MYRDRYGNPLLPASELRRAHAAVDQLAAQRNALQQQNEQLQRALASARRQLATRAEENQHLVEAFRARQPQPDSASMSRLAAERDTAIQRAEGFRRQADQALQQADEANAQRDRYEAEVHRLRVELTEAQTAAPDTARLQRLAADLANLRRNRDSQIQQGVLAEKSRLLGELAGLQDGLRRALSASPDVNDPFHQGFAALMKQVQNALAREGAVLVGTVGEVFDPLRHEAVATRQTEGPAGLVLDIAEHGLSLDDRLLRPARVVVSA
jgi:molecular chaperone GrpE